MLIFTHDKTRLFEHFRRDPVMFAYHIGDLDEFFFNRCQWAATYHKSTRIDECLLVYHSGTASTALAFGLSDRFESLLQEALDILPERFHCQHLPAYRNILSERFHAHPPVTVVRMKLGSFQSRHSERDSKHIRRLNESHRDVMREFYERAHPGNYYEDFMLKTGKYFGWFEGKELVAAAGVHVYSTEYNIGVLGNIATAPEHRGQGLATRLTSRLTSELHEEGLFIALNVYAGNVPAISCYRNLGFESAFEYEEALFETAADRSG